MTKRQLLNTYLTERLMVVVGEILEVVGGAVLEFEDETARTRRENQFLKRRLQEIEQKTGQEWTGSNGTNQLSIGTASLDDQHHQWSDSEHSQDSEQPIVASQEYVVTVLNQEHTVPTETTEWKRVNHPQSLFPQTSAPDNVLLGSTLTSQSVKDSLHQDSCQMTDPGDSYTVGNVELTCNLDGIKTEPEELCTDSSSFSGEINCQTALGPSTGVSSYGNSNIHTNLDTRAGGNSFASTYLITDAVAEETVSAQGSFIRQSIANIADSEPAACSTQTMPSNQLKQKSFGKLGQRSHLCPQCGKTFSHGSRLKIHIRIHTGEKPFVCALCGKRFNNDGTLRNHQRVHTELRLYSCPVCGMSFKDAYTCRKHQRVHNTMRRHTCICGKSFAEIDTFTKHMRTHASDMG